MPSEHGDRITVSVESENEMNQDFDSLLAILTAEETPEESSEIEALVGSIHENRRKLEVLSADEWREGCLKIAQARTVSSSSLKRGELTSWQSANQWVAEQIQAGQSLTWDHIQNINRILRGIEPGVGVVREADIFIGPYKACPSQDLPRMLSEFHQRVLCRLSEMEPLRAAAWTQYWIVSLHPFLDANGRTSVLASEWILAQNGYLPQTFSQQLDAVIAVFSPERIHRTPARACVKILNNVLRSYRLIAEPGR